MNEEVRPNNPSTASGESGKQASPFGLVGENLALFMGPVALKQFACAILKTIGEHLAQMHMGRDEQRQACIALGKAAVTLAGLMAGPERDKPLSPEDKAVILGAMPKELDPYRRLNTEFEVQTLATLFWHAMQAS